jgi:hypothetical protein
MMKINVYIFLFTFFLFSQLALGQDTIPLINPSIEGVPHRGYPGGPDIYGWKDCSIFHFPNTSPPDLHPVPGAGNSWGVVKAPFDGISYLGMVVRADHTWESVGQMLMLPVKAGQCYSFSATLSISDLYSSPTMATHTKAKLNSSNKVEAENFLTPAKLVIWGGDSACAMQERLAESSPIDHTDWKLYDFTLRPLGNYSWLIIGAYYTHDDYDQQYNGHLLIDQLSPIIMQNCE